MKKIEALLSQGLCKTGTKSYFQYGVSGDLAEAKQVHKDAKYVASCQNKTKKKSSSKPKNQHFADSSKYETFIEIGRTDITNIFTESTLLPSFKSCSS